MQSPFYEIFQGENILWMLVICYILNVLMLDRLADQDIVSKMIITVPLMAFSLLITSVVLTAIFQ